VHHMGRTEELDHVDLYELVYQATSQIPEGMVSTYGDIANALGDVRASRAVGMILSQNPTPIAVPCHRVVYSDGRVGWYAGKGQGAERKEQLLREEGVSIHEGSIVDLERTRFTGIKVRPVLREMQELQEAMRRRVMDQDDMGDIKRIAGVDVSYSGDLAYAAAVIIDLSSGGLEERVHKKTVRFPYVPTYLSFRELPSMEDVLHGLQDTLVFVDGQGQIHPRGFGIACHLGLRTGLPTIGAAKSLLMGDVDEKSGDITLNGKVKGRMTRAGGRKYYVSVGHRVSLARAESLSREYLSSPHGDVLRMAHRLANRARSRRI
jgi:deoxyribonuclease V